MRDTKLALQQVWWRWWWWVHRSS